MLMTLIVVAAAGLFAGGVVNTLADDLPQFERPRLPHYPDGAARPPRAWLGLAALFSGAWRSPGGAALTWRYPAVELLTVAAMVAAVLRTRDDPDVPPAQLVFWLAYMAIFVLIVVIDVEQRLILFSVTLPSAGLALLDALVTPTRHGPNLEDALLGAGLGFSVFSALYAVGALYVRLRKLSLIALGYGDVMLVTVSGLILGWQPLIVAMVLTVFLGAAGSLIYLVIHAFAGRGLGLLVALPYGPYIVIGTVAVLLFGGEVRALLW